ncbi:MAG: oligosaccharide flippase family protein [Bacteroidetes bacterium]|nr:oligosaccharide flippase family protein [Bacteroidota bacterium]
MLPIYTRLLSPADYGVIDMISIIGSLINVTIALEINQGFGRSYSETESIKEQDEYSSTSLWFVLFAYTLFLIFSLLFSNWLNEKIIGSNYSVTIFQIAVISIWGNGIFLFLQNQLRWYLYSKEYTIVGIVYTFVSYSITIVLMLVYKIGVVAVFWGLLSGNIAAAILSWYYAKGKYKLSFVWKKLKVMLNFSIPLVPASVGTIALLYIDRIAIKNLMSLSDVGIFGIAYRFSAIVSLVLSGFQTAMAPLIYQNYKNVEAPAEIARIFKYFLLAVLSFIIALSFFSKEVLIIFTTHAYFEAAKIIPIISFATLFLAMNIFTPGLSLAKKTKIIAAINIFAGVLNTVLNYSLIPHFGIIGASVSTLLSSILTFIIYMKYSQKYFHVPYEWPKIISVFCVGMFFVFIFRSVENMININIVPLILFKLVVLLLIILFMIKILIGFRKSKELLKYFSNVLSKKLSK